MNIIFKNKSLQVEPTDIMQDRSGNYHTVYFVDMLNGKNVASFRSRDQAIMFAIRNEDKYRR
jgi:hypothetical protein